MLQIRIDAMVRRIGSKPPGTNSIVSLSIRLLRFLVADIFQSSRLVVSPIASPDNSGVPPLATAMNTFAVAPDQLVRAPSSGGPQPRVNSRRRSGHLAEPHDILVLHVFFGPTLHRLDE
jgi:hypothetical protein